MTKIDLASREWRELVFADRNRAYGSYRMREDSPRRHTIAVLMVIAVAAVGFTIPALVRMAAPREKERMVEVTTLMQLDEPEVKQDEMKKVEPIAPPPPALKSSVKFTAPVIKKDEEVNDNEQLKTQDELTQTKAAISIADVKGNDEEHGQDIADLKQVVTQADDEQVFDIVEQAPTYPGGVQELYNWISANLKYPIIAMENGVQGRVVCQFIVGSDGHIHDVKVVRSLDPNCDKEAIRVISSMPRWIPGKQNGKAVAVRYSIPVVFRMG
jgi:protein TonB